MQACLRRAIPAAKRPAGSQKAFFLPIVGKQALALVSKEPLRGGIDKGHLPEAVIQRHNAFAEARQNRRQAVAGEHEFPNGGRKLAGEEVERLAQLADLAARAFVRPGGKIAGGHGVGNARHLPDRLYKPPAAAIGKDRQAGSSRNAAHQQRQRHCHHGGPELIGRLCDEHRAADALQVVLNGNAHQHAVHLPPVGFQHHLAACQNAVGIGGKLILRLLPIAEMLSGIPGIGEQVSLIVINIDMRTVSLIVQNKIAEHVKADLAAKIARRKPGDGARARQHFGCDLKRKHADAEKVIDHGRKRRRQKTGADKIQHEF